MILLDGIFYRARDYTGLSSGGGGTDFTVIIQHGQRWRIYGLQFLLTTDATAVNRQVQINFEWMGSGPDATWNKWIVATAAAVQGADLTYRYLFCPGAESMAAAVNNLVVTRLPYPPEIFGSTESANVGWRITSSVVNLQAGDDLATDGLGGGNHTVTWWGDKVTGALP